MDATRVLIADDEAPVRRLLERGLGQPSVKVVAAADGREAMLLAATSQFDLAVIDIEMPGPDGLEIVRRLRADPATRLMPIILLTGRSSDASKVEGLGNGADDYLTKPFSMDELAARVQSLLRRHRQSLSANPLTGLPGSPAIECEVKRRLAANESFALFHVDIDRFKGYNDAFGFARGDEVLVKTALIVRAGAGVAFTGHIGGDDFVIVTDAADAPHAAQRITTLFDQQAASFYRPAERDRGWTLDRVGRWSRRAVLTISAGVVSTDSGPLRCYAQAAALASEMKGYLKARPQSAFSRFAFDRRRRR